MRLIKLIVFAVIPLSIFSCESLPDENGDLKPPASGRMHEIILVMDSAQWAGELGEEIRKTFAAPVPNLSPPENLFTLHRVNPLKMTRVLRSASNMIFVFTLDSRTQQSRSIRNNFTREALQQIEQDTTRFSLNQADEFAKGQQVLYLFGRDEALLKRKISSNRERLQDFFRKVERQRLARKLYSGKKRKRVATNMMEERGYSIRVPFGYQLAESDDKFVWYRNVGDKYDKNFFVTYKDYQAETDFSKSNIAAWRQEISQKYILEDPQEPESYLVIDSVNMPYVSHQTAFDGRYSVKQEGWWMTNTITMGGPFISYVTLDQATNRLYYIEGFVYSPGQDKRDMLLELDAIIHTFKTQSELADKG